MNNDRRKRLSKVLAELSEGIDFSDIASQVRELADEENESADALEENFPGTAGAERSREAADLLSEAADAFEAIEIGETIGQIESAMEV